MDYIDELFSSDHSQISNIENLLETSNLSVEQQDSIYNEIKEYMTFDRAQELIIFLLNNQVDKVNGGFKYSETDIKNKIRNEIK